MSPTLRYIMRRIELEANHLKNNAVYHLHQLSLDFQILWCDAKIFWYS